MPRDPWDESREQSYPPRARRDGGARRSWPSGGPDAAARGASRNGAANGSRSARPASPSGRGPAGRGLVRDEGRAPGAAAEGLAAPWDDSTAAGGFAPFGSPERGPGSSRDDRRGRARDPRRAAHLDDPGAARARDRRQVVVTDPVGRPPEGRSGGAHHIRVDDEETGPFGKRSWLQRAVLGAGLALVVFCMLGASVAAYTLVKYGSIERVDLDLPAAAEGEPENFLIVAVDTREGQGSKNTDTIMVLRVDPKSDRLALTSFPRDLMVTIADTGKTGMINSAYARDAGGEQVLIDTLRQNFDITINHFVEVNFESFKQVVDAVGGVPVYLDIAARDLGSGFYSEDLGCVNLDGERGLQFVRSRKLEIQTEDGWENDPQSDVSRVKRQQIFIQRAMSKVLADVKSNPLRLQELVDIGVSNIRLDPNLGIGDIRDLADQFKGFDAGKLEAYPLPTGEYPQDPNRLILDEAEAEPMLNVFRGLAPGEIRPGLVNVTVLNGTVADEAQTHEGLARDVSGALQQVGFKMGEPGDVPDTFYAQTTIQYAPGQEAYAQRVARHITSTAAIPIEANPDLASGEVRLIAGADFTTVHEVATPIEAMPQPAGAAPVETTVPPAENATPAAPPPPPVPEETSPFIIGAPPEGSAC